MHRLLSNVGPLHSPDAGDTGGGSTETQTTQTPPSDRISLTKDEYTKLVAGTTRISELEGKLKTADEEWSHVRNLLKPDADPSKVEGSLRRVMAKEGYTPEQIEAYLTEQKGGGVPKGKPEPEGDEEPDALTTHLQDQEERIKRLSASQERVERDRLASVLDRSVSTALDSTKDLANLMKLLTQPTDEDGGEETDRASAVRQQVLEDVQRETLQRLRARRAKAGGDFDERWMSEEAVNAAKAVYGKLRTLIGNPSRMGRATDVSAEQDYVQSVKPKTAPEYKRGMTPDKASEASRDWAVDTLLRGAVEVERGSGSNRV